MKLQPYYFILLLSLTFLSFPVSGQGQGNSDVCHTYREGEVLQTAGVVNAGTNQFWSDIPGCQNIRTTSSVVKWAGHYSGPLLIGVVPANTQGFAWSMAASGGLVGCTVGTITVNSDVLTAQAASDAYADITMTSGECRGILTFSVNIINPATLVLYQWRTSAPIDIRVQSAPYQYVCRAPIGTPDAFNPTSTTCNIPDIANQNYQCAASGVAPNSLSNSGATCGAPLVYGMNFDILCGATGAPPLSFNAATMNCNTPTLNIGTLPTINVAGTITETIASWPHVLNASVGITSIPNLNIASIPTITVNDQVHILDAVTFHQILDGQAHLVLDNGTLYVNGVQISQTIGNQTVSVPDTLHLCGPKDALNESHCLPIQGNGTVSSATPDVVESIAGWIPLILAMFVLGVCTVGRKRPNYEGIAMSGLLFVYSAFACPWHSVTIVPALDLTLMGAFVLFFGVFLVVEYVMKRDDQNSSGFDEEDRPGDDYESV